MAQMIVLTNMAQMIVSSVLDRLASIAHLKKELGATLVVDVDDQVQKLISNFEAIRDLLDNAERRRLKEQPVEEWLSKLEDTAYDIDDALDEWSTAIQRKFPRKEPETTSKRALFLFPSPVFCLRRQKFRREEAESAANPERKVSSSIHYRLFCHERVVLRSEIAFKLKKLSQTLAVIAADEAMFDFRSVSDSVEMDRPMITSFIEPSELHARDLEKRTILKSLLCESCTQAQGPTFPIISIVGRAGMGKTSLARQVYNDDAVKAHFHERIWVSASYPTDEIRVAKSILESLEPRKVYSSKMDEMKVLQSINDSIQKKKFLLVLDDVWANYPKYWEQLQCFLGSGSQGSRILVTTRMDDVAEVIGTTQKIALRRPLSTYVVDLSEVLGRDKEKKQILQLLNETSEGPTLPVISIVGRGGTGKTALARVVFNDVKVKARFGKRIWVSASYPLDETRVARAILESLEGGAADADEMEIVLQHISERIQGKKFLLVLDDLGTNYPIYWEQLKYSLQSGSDGSRILITTAHKKKIVDKMGTTHKIVLGRLSKEACWSLLSRFAFYGRERDECQNLKHIGMKLVGKCKRLPLAIKILGSFLYSKKTLEDWQKVLDDEVWKLEQLKTKHFLPLLLSYYDLPSTLRKCFLYCAIFPKNYEIEKDRLIKLWMAQDCLKVGERKDMELIGDYFFESLAMRSVFQDFQENEYDGSIIRCKMHNIVHDFARFLAKHECFTAKVTGSKMSQLESSPKKIQHLMMTFEGESTFPAPVYNKKKLRSLVVEPGGGFMNGILLCELFDQLTCLRTLDLSNHDNVWYKVIKEVPRGIGKLIHLKYLNLSKNSKIKKLPEELCELYNLETVELSWCINLRKLPRGMGKLINLRHLVNDGTSLSYIPKGIERVTCLQTLREFIVSGGSDDSKACKLECLKNLNHLRGSLRIRRLGNESKNSIKIAELRKEESKNGIKIAELMKEESKNSIKIAKLREEESKISIKIAELMKEESKNSIKIAELRKKENLVDLYLSFEKDEEKGRKSEDDEKALEDSQLPPNLERLEISYYRGKSVSLMSIMSLNRLRLMTLDRCLNLEQLPHLGELPALESLTIRNMRSLEKVGDEFLGTDSSSSTGKSSFVAFPRLTSLEFQKMRGWREWNYSISWGKEEDIKIMPCLRSLTIGFCPKLKTFPYDKVPWTLELKIISCPLLE